MLKSVALALAVIGVGVASTGMARADDFDKKTTITFSQAVEVPGRVLPAGTYVFKLADLMGDRHVVQIFTADESQILATLMAIPDYRLTTTDRTVITFGEAPIGAPDAIRAWFYPGSSVGEEFVYPKPRAAQLAAMAKTAVPAIAVDAADVDAMKSAPIVAITPEAQEVPLAAVVQTTPNDRAANIATAPNGSAVGTTGQTTTPARQLPKTASMLPLIIVFGLGSIGVACGLLAYARRRAPVPCKP
jgi:hypothetical protein